MNFSPSLRKKILPVAAVMAPVVILQLLHSALSSGPAVATATNVVPAAPPELPKPAVAKLTFEQEKAVAWLKDPQRRFSGKSPMDHFTPPEIVVKAPPVEVIEVTPPTNPTTPAPEVLPIPQVSITTIMSRAESSGGSIAVMSGRAFKLGDTVAKGWTVSKIDRETWTVTLKCEDGREVEIGSTTKRR